MDDMLQSVRVRLARESWKWAREERSTARRECEAFVRGVLEEEGCAASDDLVEHFTDGFCRLILERKVALADMQRMETMRQAWIRAVLR